MQNGQKHPPNKSLLKMLPPRTLGLMLLQVAVVNCVLIVGSVFLGKFLDAQMNTRIVFTVLLAVASLQLALFITYKLGMRAVAKAAQVDLQRSEQEQLTVNNQQPESGTPTDQPTYFVKSS